jgi:hypothetical protein
MLGKGGFDNNPIGSVDNACGGCDTMSQRKCRTIAVCTWIPGVVGLGRRRKGSRIEGSRGVVKYTVLMVGQVTSSDESARIVGEV